jgi:hypothetical protein
MIIQFPRSSAWVGKWIELVRALAEAITVLIDLVRSILQLWPLWG